MSADLRKLLDDLDAAREKATPGPWRTGGSGIVAGLEYVASGVRTDPDAALIVAAANNLPKLTAAVRVALDACDAGRFDGLRKDIAAALEPKEGP